MKTQFQNGRIKLSQCLKLAGILLAMIFLASGCALTKDYVILSYDPQTNVEKIKEADSVKAKVEISDARSIKDRVSSKKNAYGMEMAAIIAQNDVTETLKQAIMFLSERGSVMADERTNTLIIRDTSEDIEAIKGLFR